MIAEEEIVAEVQPELMKQESSESSESTEEWYPVKPKPTEATGEWDPAKPKKKRRKTSKEYKEQARESSSLRCMLHCCSLSLYSTRSGLHP